MSQEIRFNCVGCQLELIASEDLIAVYIRCDHCETKQIVPDTRLQVPKIGEAYEELAGFTFYHIRQ